MLQRVRKFLILLFLGENCIAIVKGANDHLNNEHIENAKEIISGAKVALFQLEIDLDVTLFALKYAQDNGCKCTFDSLDLNYATYIFTLNISGIDFLQ